MTKILCLICITFVFPEDRSSICLLCILVNFTDTNKKINIIGAIHSQRADRLFRREEIKSTTFQDKVSGE